MAHTVSEFVSGENLIITDFTQQLLYVILIRTFRFICFCHGFPTVILNHSIV